MVKVFMTMMALKDADHIVRMNAYEIGQAARKDEVEVLEALKILSSPDRERKEAQPYEGRRIKAVEEGWLLLNGEKYRAQVALEMKRARNRRAQAAYRKRQQKDDPLPGEDRFVAAAKNGATEEQLDRLSDPANNK